MTREFCPVSLAFPANFVRPAYSRLDDCFFARRTSCRQMQGRRFQETGGVFAAIRRGFLGTENDADTGRLFAGVTVAAPSKNTLR